MRIDNGCAKDHAKYTEALKKSKKENYYFLHRKHFLPSLPDKTDDSDTLILSIPNTGVFKDTGYHQLCIAGLLGFARGVPTNQ